MVRVITNTTAADEMDRKAKLKEYLESGGMTGEMTTNKHSEVISLLERYHDVFGLTEGERGETDLVEMSIDAVHRRRAAQRIPFAVRPEVTKHLKSMLTHGIIQPSNSPWASLIVLAQKKDGILRF